MLLCCSRNVIFFFNLKINKSKIKSISLLHRFPHTYGGKILILSILDFTKDQILFCHYTYTFIRLRMNLYTRNNIQSLSNLAKCVNVLWTNIKVDVKEMGSNDSSNSFGIPFNFTCKTFIKCECGCCVILRERERGRENIRNAGYRIRGIKISKQCST